MSKGTYREGSYNLQCDICGKQRKREAVRPTWDGYMACANRCWYPKHPNDYPRKVVKDGLPVPVARPYKTVDVSTSVGTTMWEDDLLWETLNWNWEDDNTTLPNFIWE